MLQRRGVVVIAMVAVVAALVAVVAIDRRAAADWDTDCADPTVTYSEANPAPLNLNLDGDDVVLFASGTFEGFVNAGGATICVAESAAFDPASLNGSARLFVRGTAELPALAIDAQALLENEGTVRFLAQVNVNGLATAINHAGATIIVDSDLSLGAGATITNDGTITVNGSINLNGSTVTNNAELTITGVLNLSGTVTNTGDMDVGGVLTVNGGGQLVNTCSLTAGGLIANDDVDNSGVIELGTSELRINGGATYTQAATAFTTGGDFINGGVVTGGGQYLFSGVTTNQGSVIGTDPDSPIVFFDTSPTGDQIFDVDTGTETNVVRQEVTPPDPGACTISSPTTTTTTTSTTTSTTTTTTSTTTTSTTTTTTTLPPTTTSTTTTTTLPPTTTSTTTTTTPPPPSSTSSPSTTSTTSSTTTSTTTPGGVSPTSGVATTSNTTTTAPPSTTTTTTTVPTTTTTVPPYVGTLPNTGGSPTDGAVAAAIACTLAGLALTLAARPRRR